MTELAAPHVRLRTARAHSAVATLRRALVPVAAVCLWAGVSYGGVVRAIYVPSPTQVWEAYQAMESRLPGALASSVTMTLTGFLIGTGLGIMLGLVMGYSRTVRDLFGDVLDFTRPVPVFALIPLFVLWFGIGRGPQIALIALGTSVILGVTTIEAIRNVSHVHVRASLTLGASRLHVYRTIVLPSIFPHLLGAIRIAAAASWGLDVAAELIGAQNGLGYLMVVRQQYLDTAGILVVVFIYSVLALGLDLLIRLAERPFTRWTYRDVRAGVVASMLGRA
jgi:ABC-type nitrate/sulfonate/bicarbonate transport system permease component